MSAFHNIPAVVVAVFYDINLFILILANISGKQLSVFTVKTKAPGIAKSVGKYFFTKSLIIIYEGIVGWNCVIVTVRGAIHINA